MERARLHQCSEAWKAEAPQHLSHPAHRWPDASPWLTRQEARGRRGTQGLLLVSEWDRGAGDKSEDEETLASQETDMDIGQVSAVGSLGAVQMLCPCDLVLS